MPGKDELAARRFIISGKVQGVFFRASTVRIAEELGLRGFARNLPDGRVEVLALGDASALDSLGAWLRAGPPLATVSGVDEHSEDPAAHTALEDFRVR